jgi:hypothetical protein
MAWSLRNTCWLKYLQMKLYNVWDLCQKQYSWKNAIVPCWRCVWDRAGYVLWWLGWDNSCEVLFLFVYIWNSLWLKTAWYSGTSGSCLATWETYWEDYSSRPAWANSSRDPTSKITRTKWTEGMQAWSLEFKAQSHQTTTKNCTMGPTCIPSYSGRLRQEDHLNLGFWSLLGQHSESPNS